MLALTSIVSSLNFSKAASRSDFRNSLKNLMVSQGAAVQTDAEALPVKSAVKAGSTRFSDFGSFEQFSNENRAGFNARRGKSTGSPKIGVELQYMWGTTDTFR